MLNVDSSETINTLSGKFMKINKGRNVIAIIAIIMTTVMFTSLFTSTLSVFKSNQQQEMRNTMCASHITVEKLTKQQYDEVSKYENANKMGYTVFMSLAENKKLNTSQTEIRYADKNGAVGYLSNPTTGRLPIKDNEVAMSTITLDLLGVQHKVGSKISLEYTANGKTQTGDFVLSGYWKGDPLFLAQEVWVAKNYCLAHIKPATEQTLSTSDFEGCYSLSFWFHNVLKLQDYANEINCRYNLIGSSADVSINPAYDYMTEDAFPFSTIALLLLIIFASGYLIIYNVFKISVNSDIRAYGLLKNVGTTGRQLKRIVRKQALYMSAIGIPVGLILGFLIGRAMTPYLLSDMDTMGVNKVKILISVNPAIFVLAAVFSLITVYIGCIRPCHIVASISPVEAVKMTENDSTGRERGSARVTPISMAMGNANRTWKKAVVVIISLALPIMVLNGVFTIVKGFNFDTYISEYISSDFNISGCTSNLQSSNFRAISPELTKQIESREEVKSVAVTYDYETSYKMDAKGYDNINEMVNAAGKNDYISKAGIKNEKELLATGEMPEHLMGINEDAFNKMEFQDKKCSWEEFSTGKYVIVGKQPQGLGNYYDVGDTVSLEGENGSVKEYEVLSIGSEPNDLDYPFGAGTWFPYTFMLPDTEYLASGGDAKALKIGIDVKKGTEEAFGKWLSESVEKSGQSLYIESKLDIKEQCKGFAGKYYMVLGLLCIVLFVIGIMNFYNTSSVSIMTRKRELSLLEAVGMTRKQLRQMLIAEGVFYLLAAIVVADTLGLYLSKLMIQSTIGDIFFFTCKMNILPSLAAIPFLLAIAILIPLKTYRNMCRETVVERIRND